MKLQHLFEAVDRRPLLTDVARELGFTNPAFFDIDDDTSNLADVDAGIDLFRLHLDTEGSAQVQPRLHYIESLAVNAPATTGMEALEYLDGTTFHELPHVKAFHDAQAAISRMHERVQSSCKTATTVYLLLTAVNAAATTTHSSKFDDDELKYRASIAAAVMKQLGMKPKVFE